MRGWVLFFWALAALFLQQALTAMWGIDLPLIFVSLVGLRSKPLKAASVGFGFGLAQDLLSAGWIGPNLISKLLAALVAVLVQKKIYRERLSTQTLLIFSNALLQQWVIWFLMKGDGQAPSFDDAVWIALPSVLLTALVGMVVCFVVVRFRRRRFDPATA
ncbi:MAG: rod shape-determining protein MreD [bacterium]